MKRNKVTLVCGVLVATLLVGCADQETPPNKFERLVKCREIADKYSNSSSPSPEENAIVTTVGEVIYKENRGTCFARVNVVIRVGETVVSSADQVRDILTNKVLASSGNIGGSRGNWYYDENNVEQFADEKKVRAVMDELMRN